MTARTFVERGAFLIGFSNRHINSCLAPVLAVWSFCPPATTIESPSSTMRTSPSTMPLEQHDLEQGQLENGVKVKRTSATSQALVGERRDNDYRPLAGDDLRANSYAQINMEKVTRRTWVTVLLICILGLATTAFFFYLGISSAASLQMGDPFLAEAGECIRHVYETMFTVESSALWVHSACYNGELSRSEFQALYELVTSQKHGFPVQAVECVPNVTRDQRRAFELEAAEFYAENYPSVNYSGFQELVETSSSLIPRQEADFYFPIHFLEPIIGNERAIDFDHYSSPVRRASIDTAIKKWTPSVTERLHLVQDENPLAYAVLLMHPGSPIPSRPNQQPRDLAIMAIRIEDLLMHVTNHSRQPLEVYLFDTTDGREDFLGAVGVEPLKNATLWHSTTPKTLDELQSRRQMTGVFDDIGEREWTVVVAATGNTFEPDSKLDTEVFAFILVAMVIVALWFYSNSRRIRKVNAIKAASEAEKAAAVLDTVRRAADAERELNDYIAHEVRNPVAAAMSACSFVKAAVNDKEPCKTEETRNALRDDVGIIDQSLHFVNDLLRNMLDMHRASSDQLRLDLRPTDIEKDIFEPVGAMLYHRTEGFEITIECARDESLVIVTDPIRLKQIILNLTRNSSKFVQSGFIRMTAAVVDGNVQLAVEDSGPGVPMAKRDQLFCKFQESLDTLSQGTGVGLFLCQKLAHILGGEISLDGTYDSGIPGCPGARFVVDLCTPPVDFDSEYKPAEESDAGETEPVSDEDTSELQPLPETISVLFVDDDLVLRKLFCRALKKVFPGWSVTEASSGEAALQLVETQSYDVIFMDMYMASVEKRLMGTETVVALRAKGIECRICGLSANNMEKQFLQAGADTFLIKPFPCQPNDIKVALRQILYTDSQHGAESQHS